MRGRDTGELLPTFPLVYFLDALWVSYMATYKQRPLGWSFPAGEGGAGREVAWEA
jgi:hypothetical protein